MTGAPETNGPRREPGGHPQEDLGDVLWPTWLRYLLPTLLFAVIGVGLVTVLYDRGLLPIAGPFAAMALAPLIGALVLWWLVRRTRGLADRATGELEALLPALEQERRLPRDRRSSRATDETLDAALSRSRLALSKLGWGHTDDAVGDVHGLARVATQWSPDSAVASRVSRVVADAERLQKTRRRIADRRRSPGG